MVKVRDLIGGRFVSGGRDIKTGMDCWGLVMEVYKRNGITIPDFSVGAFDYAVINALMDEAVGSLVWERVGTPVSTDAPLVVLMRMHPKLITHAGVYVGGNRIIHTMRMTGVIMSRVDGLKSRITGYYRYAENNQHS